MLVRIEEIIIADRQRTKIPAQELKELRDSILARGLLHAPVVSKAPGENSYRLIAGERRIRAIQQIYESDQAITYDGKVFIDGELPVTRLEDMSLADLFAAELEENLMRQELSWQDRARAIARLAELERLERPAATKQEVAEAISEKLPPNPVSGQPLAASHVRATTRQAELITKNLDRPEIAKARSFHEAAQLVLKEDAAKFEAEMIRRRKATIAAQTKDPKADLIEVRQGDCLEILPKMEDKTYDLILSDPPYGLNADKQGFRGRSKEHHNYEDNPEYAEEILLTILREGFRVTKNKANIFLFTDIDRFYYLRGAASRMGWTPWRTPIIWRKSETEGLVPWGRQGFARTYEIIFWATKGQAGLRMPLVDIIDQKRVPRHTRVHAAEKPVGLLQTIIDATTIVGDRVLDPCAGSGSTLEAAYKLQRRATGIELEQRFVDIATVRCEDQEAAISLAKDLEAEDAD
jgi:site-specific DNA-methyltransferase (adenine-specific)